MKEIKNDGVQNGVHTFTPEGYIAPPTELLQKNLEDFRDKKLGLMMHFGPYSEWGFIESWALCDEDKIWSQKQIDWTKDPDKFKTQYYALNKTFNPVRFDPERWAKLAKNAGCRYFLFTMKHHDGFCMYDTDYTDYKISAPDCPYSKSDYPDLAGSLFKACRKEGIGVNAYFSKPDWHNEDFWENHGIGFETNRYPTYDTTKNPEKWENFVKFLHAQVEEIADKYEPDVLWFDGGWIRAATNTDPRMEELIARIRERHPGILAANRTVTGCCEDFITPEQTFPPQPLTVPWESCITIAEHFSFRFEQKYKSPRTIIHSLIKIVARGGNLALNITPQPDGGIDHKTYERLAKLGSWLGTMGDAIYSTRIRAPYQFENIYYTGSKDGKTVYAIRLWENKETAPKEIRIPLDTDPSKVKKVTLVSTGEKLSFRKDGDAVTVSFPDGFCRNEYADAIRIELA